VFLERSRIFRKNGRFYVDPVTPIHSFRGKPALRVSFPQKSCKSTPFLRISSITATPPGSISIFAISAPFFMPSPAPRSMSTTTPKGKFGTPTSRDAFSDWPKNIGNWIRPAHSPHCWKTFSMPGIRRMPSVSPTLSVSGGSIRALGLGAGAGNGIASKYRQSPVIAKTFEANQVFLPAGTRSRFQKKHGHGFWNRM